jgi:hypothetical protein
MTYAEFNSHIAMHGKQLAITTTDIFSREIGKSTIVTTSYYDPSTGGLPPSDWPRTGYELREEMNFLEWRHHENKSLTTNALQQQLIRTPAAGAPACESVDQKPIGIEVHPAGKTQ